MAVFTSVIVKTRNDMAEEGVQHMLRAAIRVSTKELGMKIGGIVKEIILMLTGRLIQEIGNKI